MLIHQRASLYVGSACRRSLEKGSVIWAKQKKAEVLRAKADSQGNEDLEITPFGLSAVAPCIQ